MEPETQEGVVSEISSQQTPITHACNTKHDYHRILSIVAIGLLASLASYLTTRNQVDEWFGDDVSMVQTAPHDTNVNQTFGAEKVYFGKDLNGVISMIDTVSGESKELIPAGYTLVGGVVQTRTNPNVLILQKENDLFAYTLKNKTLQSIFGATEDLKLKKDEEVEVQPSITEKDKFIIKINKVNLSEINGFDGSSPILSTRSYIFDATTNKVENTNIERSMLGMCQEFDSKNQRMFKWRCGEGIGSIIPLSTYDLNGVKVSDVITRADFGVGNDGMELSVSQDNGIFFAIEENKVVKTVSKILVLDPQSINAEKTLYTVSDQIMSEIAQSNKYSKPYSVLIDAQQSSIIFGGSDYILLLRYDKNNQITQSTFIPEKEVYANFMFVYNGKLYYRVKGDIRVVSLATQQVEKTIPSTDEMFAEVGLFVLPE